MNAVRHGNCCDEDRKVYLELASNGEQCLIRVRDEGQGFSPETIQMPQCDQLGGRGICLMKHYMEKVRFNPRTRCLELLFRRKLDVPAES